MESGFIRLLRTVLPVHDLRQCVLQLAAGWQEVTGSQFALVAVARPAEDRLVAAVCKTGSPAHFLDGEALPVQGFNYEEVLPALANRADVSSTGELIETAIAFGDPAEAIGGVLLFAEAGLPQDVGTDELAKASGLLLRQAIALEQTSEDIADTLRPDPSRLEALAEFAAGAGHEINNPLATISGRVQMLLKDEQDPERRVALQTIGGQALRIRDMIGDVMVFARPPKPEPVQLDLVDVLGSVLASFQERATQQGCTIEIEADGAVAIWADRVQLSVVISGLIENSLDALGEGGPIFITARSCSETRRAILSVADNGPGLSEIDRRHLFDPFYSGRQAGRGLGFGLSKCWRIVSNHGGRIEVDCGSNPAVCFRVLWPADG